MHVCIQYTNAQGIHNEGTKTAFCDHLAGKLNTSYLLGINHPPRHMPESMTDTSEDNKENVTTIGEGNKN